MQKDHNDIIIFFIVVFLIIVFLGVYVISMLYFYKKKQHYHTQKYQDLKLDKEKAILSAQLEMQEETFNHISKEIHDNISLALTLAKLNLNTLDFSDHEYRDKKIANSIELITRSILELNDISKSLNSEIIINHGILKALDLEIAKITGTGIIDLEFKIEGNPIFQDAKKELIIFRIIQESFNNIIKHAAARKVTLSLDYDKSSLTVSIIDDGKGFDPAKITDKTKSGLNNMANRVKLLRGHFSISTFPDKGTEIKFSIPIEQL